MIRSSAAGSELEICGALLGTQGVVTEALPLDNESLAREHSFYIPARVVLHLEREAEARGQMLLGFYHSHPDGDAVPSGLDLQEAVPGYIYVIAARSGELRGWRLREDRSGFDEVALSNGDNG